MGSNEEKLEAENVDGFGLGFSPSSPISGCLSEDQLSIKSDDLSCVRVKLMCSYGGRILPRPQDGQLRYIGGETRIVVVDRSISFAELSRRLSRLAGKPVLIKYQLPDEDLDALVSVKTDEDLDNMMDEYEKMLARDSSSRLRVFLFFPLMKQQQQQQQSGGAHTQPTEQHFVEALNSLPMSVEHEEMCHCCHQHFLEGQAAKFRQQQQHHHHHQVFVDEPCTGYHHHQHNLMVGSPPSVPVHKLPPPPLPPPRAAFVDTVYPLDHHKGMLRSSSRSPTRHNPGMEESPRSPGLPSSSRFRELQQGAVLHGLYDQQQQQQPQSPHYRLATGGYHYYKS